MVLALQRAVLGTVRVAGETSTRLDLLAQALLQASRANPELLLEVRKLKQLEDENRRLKQMVADLSLDKAMLQDVLSKKV